MEDKHMIHRLKSYRNGIHGGFFLEVAKRLEENTRPTPEAKNVDEAKDLATSIWKQHYFDDSPDWTPLDTLPCVLSQISNMVSGMVVAPTTPKAIKDIEWVGECKEHTRFCNTYDVPCAKSACSKCNGTGTITRQATMGEVVEVLRDIMELMQGHELDCALKVNNGTLSIKEK